MLLIDLIIVLSIQQGEYHYVCLEVKLRLGVPQELAYETEAAFEALPMALMYEISTLCYTG